MSGGVGIAPVLLRFPQWRTRICRLALRDEDFRALCEDYGIARKALANFEAAGGDPPRAEVGEYRQLIDELEGELVSAIFEATDDGSPSFSGRGPG